MNRYSLTIILAMFLVTASLGIAGPAAGAGRAKSPVREKVHLSAQQLNALDIKVKKAVAGSAASKVIAPATAAFDADRVAKVGPLLAAKVVKVTHDLGDRVQAGETLAVLNSVDLGKAKARYLTTQARLATAAADYQREKKLAKKQISSEAELLDAKADYIQAQAESTAVKEELRLYGLDQKAIGQINAGSDTPLSYYALRSPRAGVIQRRALTPGQTIAAGETPILIVDTRRLWMMITVYEKDLPRISTGQRVAIKPKTMPARTFRGRIDWISRKLDQKTRTVRVRAVVDNPDGLLRAGMFAQAYIQTGAAQDAVLVPLDAVQSVANRSVVFVPGDASGSFRAQPVRLGEESGGRVEVLKGLSPGEALVVSGAFDLKAAMTAGNRSGEH